MEQTSTSKCFHFMKCLPITADNLVYISTLALAEVAGGHTQGEEKQENQEDEDMADGECDTWWWDAEGCLESKVPLSSSCQGCSTLLQEVVEVVRRLEVVEVVRRLEESEEISSKQEPVQRAENSSN